MEKNSQKSKKRADTLKLGKIVSEILIFVTGNQKELRNSLWSGKGELLVGSDQPTSARQRRLFPCWASTWKKPVFSSFSKRACSSQVKPINRSSNWCLTSFCWLIKFLFLFGASKTFRFDTNIVSQINGEIFWNFLGLFLYRSWLALRSFLPFRPNFFFRISIELWLNNELTLRIKAKSGRDGMGGDGMGWENNTGVKFTYVKYLLLV